jgi:acyl-coenzyme A thioesterase PaaI-like protein
MRWEGGRLSRNERDHDAAAASPGGPAAGAAGGAIGESAATAGGVGAPDAGSPRGEDDDGAPAGADVGAGSTAGANAGVFGAGADPAVLAALTALAGRTRELVEAVVLSDAAIDELDAVAAEIDELTSRLGTRRRAVPIRVGFDPGNGELSQPHSPVTGEANPLAPPVRIKTTPQGTARAEFILGHVYEGPPDAVHGGVCAAILDHVLGFAAAAGDRPGMTAMLSLRYLRPTPVGVPLVAEAWISGVDGHATTVHGRILNERAVPTVEADGQFVLPRRWRSLAKRGEPPAATSPGDAAAG